ncbi:hypothetical protein FRC08_013804 [Ceratobasidium sp. 394]|nr:hypothetical protein FRC08_013804 [Ceratobasidium sp. 394]
MWCAVNHCPFHTVSDPLFIDIVDLLRPRTSVPCPQTVSSDLSHIYNKLSTDIQESFQEIETAMHLAVDGWSTPLTALFLGVIVFWRQDGIMWSSILDFIHIVGSHTGEHMAKMTVECLERLGVKNHISTTLNIACWLDTNPGMKIMSICLDNASNNDTFVKHIEPALPQFLGPQARTRCLAHIANLAAHAFLDVFGRPSSKKRWTVAKSAVKPKRSTPNAASTHPVAVSSLLGVSGNANDPEVILDELDGILELPDDSDEGKQLADQGEVKLAVTKSLEHMKAAHGVVIPPGELADARDLFPKVNGFATQILNSNNLQAASEKRVNFHSAKSK